VSATVSPEFLADTYPAMVALTRALDDAGLRGVWVPEDERTFRLGRARHTFISVDRPPQGPAGTSPRPDALLEVVSSERMDADWFHTRVCPRTQTEGLTTVIYGNPGGDTVFERVRKRDLLAEWRDGVRRHFSLGAPRVGNPVAAASRSRRAGALALAGW